MSYQAKSSAAPPTRTHLRICAIEQTWPGELNVVNTHREKAIIEEGLDHGELAGPPLSTSVHGAALEP